MSKDLFDKKTDEIIFSANAWHWGAIVAEIQRLKILDENKIENLFNLIGLNKEDCEIVAKALIKDTISSLEDSDRLLLDGSKTKKPDDCKFHRVDLEKNYSTNKQVLLEFINAIKDCNGFKVY